MKVIEQTFSTEGLREMGDILQYIEKIGRVCYKSENLITADSAKAFVTNIIKNGHEAIIEHFVLSVRAITDRGVSHEIVRHRIASYAQESTRYCNYSKDKFDGQLTFIKPVFWNEGSEEYETWKLSMEGVEEDYLLLISMGATPQEARTVLPNSLKTEIIMTMNLREWRHFFKLRCAPTAHPQMRDLALKMLKYFRSVIPVIFDDIKF